jgi:hypothetical protein
MVAYDSTKGSGYGILDFEHSARPLADPRMLVME